MPAHFQGYRDPELWRTGSAREEARSLYRLFQRQGERVDEMLALIDVSAAERRELAQWAANHPGLMLKISGMIFYRSQVRKEFLALLKGVQGK